jgi:hypothetical protein
MENKFVEEAAKMHDPMQDDEAWKRLEGVVASQLGTVAAFWENAGRMAEEEALVNAPSKLGASLQAAAAKLRDEASRTREDADLDATATGDERALSGTVARMTKLNSLAGADFENALRQELKETGATLLAWQARMAKQLPSASRLQEALATLKTAISEQQTHIDTPQV